MSLVESQPQNAEIFNIFSDCLKTIDHLNLEL